MAVRGGRKNAVEDGMRPPGKFHWELDHHAFDSRKAACLLTLIADGHSQDSACRAMGNKLSRKTIQAWALKDTEFAAGLALAERARLLGMVDGVMDMIADHSQDFITDRWSEVDPNTGNVVERTRRVHNPSAFRRTQLAVSTLKFLVTYGVPDRFGAFAGAQQAGPPMEVPAWVRAASPETQMELIMVLAKAKREGESRVLAVAQEVSDDGAGDDDADVLDAASPDTR